VNLHRGFHRHSPITAESQNRGFRARLQGLSKAAARSLGNSQREKLDLGAGWDRADMWSVEQRDRMRERLGI